MRLLNRSPPLISLVLNHLLVSVKHGLYMNKTECGRNYLATDRLSTCYTVLTLQELDMLLDFLGRIYEF